MTMCDEMALDPVARLQEDSLITKGEALSEQGLTKKAGMTKQNEMEMPD